MAPLVKMGSLCSLLMMRLQNAARNHQEQLLNTESLQLTTQVFSVGDHLRKLDSEVPETFWCGSGRMFWINALIEDLQPSCKSLAEVARFIFKNALILHDAIYGEKNSPPQIKKSQILHHTPTLVIRFVSV